MTQSRPCRRSGPTSEMGQKRQKRCPRRVRLDLISGHALEGMARPFRANKRHPRLAMSLRACIVISGLALDVLAFLERALRESPLGEEIDRLREG
jgi:hypothetical protein